MFERSITSKIISTAAKYQALALVGPRQSGKTTLAKAIFPDYAYVSLENPDSRRRAIDDPRGFLASLDRSTVLDEVQNTPELFSYLQERIDDSSDNRKFVLTGSNSFQLNEKISQSLAGRIRIFHILPLTYRELPLELSPASLDDLLITGLYPRIYDEELEPNEWFVSYYQTYLQKDIKAIINVSDTNQFDKFVRLCAGRIAQIGEYSSIASEVGVSQPTAVRWASVLESSFITFRLAPHFKNFNKRIIKTPKVYFYDTGLLCQLLRIKSTDVLATHPLRGEIFENFIVSEAMKACHNLGIDPPLFYWRDQHGHEIDLVVDQGLHLLPIEIKSGATFHPTWLRNLEWFAKLQSLPTGHLVYGGDSVFHHRDFAATPWRQTVELVETLVR